jgi:hypothetical protein
MVRVTQTPMAEGYLTICQAETKAPIAVVPPLSNGANWADAALLCAAPNMLEALIEIHDALLTSKEPISIDWVKDVVSQVVEKIASESGTF